MWYFALAIVRFLVEMMFFGNIVGGVGARASAVYFSLVETAKANGPEPYDSLCRALRQIPYAQTVEDWEALLPWNMK
jgi:hypothetical protein